MRTTKTAAAAGRCHAPSAATALFVHHFTGSLPRRSFLFLGPSPHLSSSFVYPFPFSLPLSRRSEYYRPFSYPVHFALFLSRADQPSILSLSFFIYGDTHAHTHFEAESCAKEDHRTRHLQLGRLPNVPTATVDTLPNFLSSMARTGGGRGGRTTVKFEN